MLMHSIPTELVNLWDIACPNCQSELLNKNGKYKNRQRFLCLECGKTFTSYSKSLLNASKIKRNQWNDVVAMILKGYSLKEIEEVSDISYVSLSKIRLKILQVFDTLNSFHILLNQNKAKNVFLQPFQKNRHILTLQDKKGRCFSRCYDESELDKLKKRATELNLRFVEDADIDDMDITNYHDSLLHHLSMFRGIKHKYINYYITFHAVRYYLSITEALNYLTTHMAVCLSSSHLEKIKKQAVSAA